MKTRKAYFQNYPVKNENAFSTISTSYPQEKELRCWTKTDTREQGLGGGSILNQGITKWKKHFNDQYYYLSW